jgi:biotin carboxyl carrier protein
MKRLGSIQGREFALQLDPADPGWRFRLDGGAVQTASTVHPEPGVYLIALNGRTYEARVEAAGESLTVSVAGRRFAVELRDPRRWNPGSARQAGEGPANVIAPMPGRVVRVLVQPGAAVERGQGILVVEAMKMQNELKAPKAGRVLTLPFAEGAAVSAGDVLATIE